MPTRCCVPGCGNRKSSFAFPKDLAEKKKWRVNIRRADPKTKALWKPNESSRVCEDHFAPSDFVPTLMGERKRLKRGAVPQLKILDITSASMRSQRYKSRQTSIKQDPSPVSEYTSDSQPCNKTPVPIADCDVPSIESEVEIGDGSVNVAGSKNESPPPTDRLVDCGSQCRLLIPSNGRLSHRNFVNCNEAIQYYTSFDDHEQFMYFFNVLGPAARNLKFFQCIPEPEDQLFLTLMKLRQAKDDIELSFMFKICPSSVAEIFSLWVNFMYVQLSELNLWPSGDVIEEYMPKNFGKLFPKTKMILDATETPVQKPQNADAQSCTYSTYKNKNTVKTMIGCSPRGVVTYVSDSYGGSTSDRQIIERSSLMTDYPFNSKDSIMADRGIMVQDLFSSRDVQVNTPHMLKGKHQLDAKELVYDRRIASKRIHVERVIALAKTFKILKKVHPNL